MTCVYETIVYPAFLFLLVTKELPSTNQVLSGLGRGVLGMWRKGERLDRTSEHEWGLCWGSGKGRRVAGLIVVHLMTVV